MKAYIHRRSSLLGAALLLLCLSLTAQNVREDLLAIQAKHAHLSEGGQAVQQYQYFLDDRSPAAETVVSESYWSGSSHYLKSGNAEQLQNERYALLVNHELETIIIQAPNQEMQQFEPLHLDSLLTLCEEVQFDQLSSGLHAYTFDLGFLTYRKIRVEYEPTTYRLRRMVYFEAEPWDEEDSYARLEVTFKELSPLPAAQAGKAFAENRFVRFQGDKVLPATAYQDYQLLNYLP